MPSPFPDISSLDAFLESALQAGIKRIGQVVIKVEHPGYSICHVDDEGLSELELHTHPYQAVAIALYDDNGDYRPLKTAPNLRHGWTLAVASLSELRQALDYLYPAALGNWRSQLEGACQPVSLRETVNRQTGMYRVAGKITDEQGEMLVEKVCREGCLRHILWSVPIDGATAAWTMEADGKIMPLLCCEACNLLVAAARKVAKGIPLDQAES